MLHSLFRASRDLGAASSQVMALLGGGAAQRAQSRGERAVWIWPFPPLSLSQELVDVRRVAWPPMPPFLPSTLCPLPSALSLSLSCRQRLPPPPPDALCWPWMPPAGASLSLVAPTGLSPPRPNRQRIERDDGALRKSKQRKSNHLLCARALACHSTRKHHFSASTGTGGERGVWEGIRPGKSTAHDHERATMPQEISRRAGVDEYRPGRRNQKHNNNNSYTICPRESAALTCLSPARLNTDARGYK